MIDAALTVGAKELKEILSSGGPAGGRRGLIGRFAFPVIFGAFLGYQAGLGRGGFGRAAAVFPIGLIAMGTAASLIADAVAGERERHTLETLLASPVSDTAIIVGKVGAVVLYSWVVAVIGLIAVGVSSALAPRPIPVPLLLLVAVLALLEALMAAAFGVQFSLHSESARDAARRQGQYSIFINLVAAGINGVAVARVTGAVRVAVVGGAMFVLIAVDVALLLLARVRFRRPRLLLD